MIKKVALTKEYVRVKRKADEKRTFGGDQNFFDFPGASKADEHKIKCGCGIVAFADLLLYLGAVDGRYRVPENYSYVNRELSEAEYRQYYNSIYDFMGGIPGKVGISGLKLWFKFNKLARREGWPLRAKWGFSGKKLYDRTEEMLRQDIPVICCIPMMLLKKDKKDYLCLYRQKEESGNGFVLEMATSTRAHYVMITGVISVQEEIFYEVSSWGKKYYVNRKEYDDFIQNHFMGILLGNILYIYAR